MVHIKEQAACYHIKHKNSTIPGNKYVPASLVPKSAPGIKEVRRRLSKIKESLAETIVKMREED